MVPRVDRFAIGFEKMNYVARPNVLGRCWRILPPEMMLRSLVFTGWEISRRRDRADGVARLEGKGRREGRIGYYSFFY